MLKTEAANARSLTPQKNSLPARIMAGVLRASLKQTLSSWSPLWLQRASAHSLKYTLLRPSGTRRQWLDVPGFKGFRHAPVSGAGARTILYLHGGGFQVGSPATSHLALTMRLTKLCGQQLYAPQYRLAPQHKYPAQLDDAVRAFDYILATGVDAADVTVIGDSAGGNLTLALLQKLRADGRRLPRAAVLISPWCDLTMSTSSKVKTDALLGPGWLKACRAGFAAPEQYADPKVSPLRADFTGFPPILIQSAGAEPFTEECRQLAAALRTAGVESVLDETPGMWHDFQLCGGVVPEADRALERIAAYVKAH